MPFATTSASHPPTVNEPWIYTFYLNYIVRYTGLGAPNRWRVTVHAHVHVMPAQVPDPHNPGVLVPGFQNVQGSTFVPGYDCWRFPGGTPLGIVARAPDYDPGVHPTLPGGPAWGNANGFFDDDPALNGTPWHGYKQRYPHRY